jgi:hypothetical protein
MKRNPVEKGLDITLAACGIFFLAMGATDLGKDLFGVLLGFGTALPLALVYAWRKIRESRGKSVHIRAGNLALFCIALFFLVMGVSGFASNRDTILLGLSVGVPLGAIYLWRRILEYREADAQADEKAAAPDGAPEQAMTVCPHCGAPTKGGVCPYCGLDKKQ